MNPRPLLLHALLPLAALGAGMRDAPIAADALQYLDGLAWRVSDNSTINVPATVPGDLITDLERAGVIPDPLYERNFKSLVWDQTDFTFSLSFDADAAVMGAPTRWLVLDSVKMGAFVWLNGAFLGLVSDQFLRWKFDVSSILLAAGNSLNVTFPPSNSSANDEARWMAASGAWDWAPYTSSYNSLGAHTMSKGIVRSAYLAGVAASSAAVEHLQPRVYYRGAYPTIPLTDAGAGPWDVVARVHLTAPAAASGTLSVSGSWGGSASAPVSLTAGNQSVELTIRVPAGAVSLWWPLNLGAQALYNLTATFTPSEGNGAALVVQRRLGFRFFALVTGNDTDPTTLAGVDGSDSFSMRWNVNGAKVWSRGANLIPMDEMEGRLSFAAHAQMVKSAANAGINTFRVWGGGSFYADVVYDTADELGIMM
jgi:beta-mannosidase